MTDLERIVRAWHYWNGRKEGLHNLIRKAETDLAKATEQEEKYREQWDKELEHPHD